MLQCCLINDDIRSDPDTLIEARYEYSSHGTHTFISNNPGASVTNAKSLLAKSF